MSEVATEAGISLNTIHVSVGKKPQLLLALFRDASEDADIEATLATIGAGADQRARRRYPRGLRALRLGLGALYDNASASDEISEALDATEARYRDHDAFYEGVGTYSLFRTCNTWANKALKVSGQKACLWTPVDKGMFYQYRKD